MNIHTRSFTFIRLVASSTVLGPSPQPSWSIAIVGLSHSFPAPGIRSSKPIVPGTAIVPEYTRRIARKVCNFLLVCPAYTNDLQCTKPSERSIAAYQDAASRAHQACSRRWQGDTDLRQPAFFKYSCPRRCYDQSSDLYQVDIRQVGRDRH